IKNFIFKNQITNNKNKQVRSLLWGREDDAISNLLPGMSTSQPDSFNLMPCIPGT
ncbi:hypothetical protein STEG23_028780, partial [Scotinomys teguina]